jgi:hypothetical protein
VSKLSLQPIANDKMYLDDDGTVFHVFIDCIDKDIAEENIASLGHIKKIIDMNSVETKDNIVA